MAMKMETARRFGRPISGECGLDKTGVDKRECKDRERGRAMKRGFELTAKPHVPSCNCEILLWHDSAVQQQNSRSKGWRDNGREG